MLPPDSSANDDEQQQQQHRTRRASSSRASIVSSSYFSPPTATTAQEAADTFLLIQHLLIQQQQQPQPQPQPPPPPPLVPQLSHLQNHRSSAASAPSSPGLHPLQSSRSSQHQHQYPHTQRPRSRAGSGSSSSHSHNLHNLHSNGSQSTLIPSLFPLTPLPSSLSALPPPHDDLPPSYTVATQSSSHAGTPPLQRPRSRRTSSSSQSTNTLSTTNNAPSQRGAQEEILYAPSGSLPPSRRSSVRAQSSSRAPRSRPGSSSGSGAAETPMFTAPNSGRNSNRNSVCLAPGGSEHASRRSSLHLNSGTHSPALARQENDAVTAQQQVSTDQDLTNLRQRRWNQSRSSSAQTISQQPRPHLSRSSTVQPIHYTSMESTPSNQDDSRSAVSSAPSRKITASKMRSKWSFKYLLPHHLLRFLLRILLTPIWLFTSVPHSSQAVVDAQPWGIRVLLFPLRLFAAVPGSIGTFWLLRNTWVGIRNEGFGPWTKPAKLGSGREEHPPAVVFAIASLWSLSTAYYALSLTTLLLRRWLLYYSPLSSIIRLVALQAICWPLVRITLFVFGPHRPLEAWILIATTTTFSDTVARWLVSNIVDRIDGGLDAWVGEESDLGWGSRSQSRNADWEREGDDSTQMGQSERHQRRRDRRRRGPVLAGGRSEEEGSEPNGHAHRPERERRLRARSSYPDRMLRNDVGAALLAFEVKDTTTDDTGSGSEVDLDVDLEVYPDGTTRRRRRHPRDRRGTSSRRHPPQGRMSASEGFRYEHPSPRRTASFPRLPTSDLLFDTPPSSSSSTSATSSSSAGTASDGEHNQGGRDRRATRRARQAANGTGAAGGGDGAESGADETPLTLMLPVRRVFHWDVAIKRNILPMGVLAYVSLWVLLGHSRVEGRGR